MRIFKSFLLSAIIAFIPFSLSAVTVDEVIEKALFLRACPAPQNLNEDLLKLEDLVPTMLKSFQEQDSTH